MPTREVEISQAAERDLEAIFRYTRERWGEAQAVSYIEALNEGFDGIAETPGLGRDRSEEIEGGRSRILARHVVFYTFTRERAVIIRVLHPAQDPRTLLGPGPDG
ncbi:MAG: type II toxin-antitoxin system RelE/ParE family toxin [Oceanicaulis sp.]